MATKAAQVVFASDLANDGRNHLYRISTDGSHLTRLTNDATFDVTPAWSPDGSKIAYASDSTSSKYVERQIYVMSADGSCKRRLTDSGDNFDPAWSPDGRKIAFARYGAGIYEVNTDGTGEKRLTDYSPLGDDSSPTWSADGREIAFDSNGVAEPSGDGFVSQIYVMNADGTGPTAVTPSTTYSTHPSWSPDGRQIAFAAGDGQGRLQIWLMNADGSNRWQVTTDGGDYPDWSSGGRLVYDHGLEISVIDTDGSHEVQLTNNGAMNLEPAAWPR